jgi:hypothetical protein
MTKSVDSNRVIRLDFAVSWAPNASAEDELLSEQKNTTGLLWILSLALVLRVVTLARIDPVALDSAIYFEIARLIEAGKWKETLSYPFPPFYPGLIAALTSLGLSLETAGVFVSMASTLLVLFPLWTITRALAGEAAASWAAFLWAVHPYAIRLGSRALSDAPTALFVALSLWAGLRGLRTVRFRWPIGSGALAGLAYLCRPEGIEPVLGVTVTYALWTWKTLQPEAQQGPAAHSPRFLWVRRLCWIGTPLAAFALVAAPYVALISLDAGTLTFSKKKSPAAMMRSMAPKQNGEILNLPADSVEPAKLPEDAATPKLEKTIAGNRLWTAARNLYLFQQPFINGIHLIVLLPAFLAFWHLRPNQNPQQRAIKNILSGLLLLHLFVLVGLTAQLGPTYLGGHHTFLMVFYMLPFAGAGLAGLLGRLRAHVPAPNWATPVLVALLIAVTLPSSVFRRPESGAVYRTAGLWIKNHSQTPPTVITNSAKLAYHAGALRIPSAGDVKRVVDSARTIKADFIAVPPDDREGDFQSYVDAGALEVAAVLSERSGNKTYRVVVYRLRPL